MGFDEFAAGYSQAVDRAVAFSGRKQEFFLDAKARQLTEALHRTSGERPVLRALEVGCGTGLMQRRLRAHAGRLWGIDTSLRSLAHAKHAGNGAGLVAADGQLVPFADSSFDLVFAVCVLHHVAPGHRGALVQEMARLARPGGLVALLEHNPWNPLTRRVVADCPFDRDAILLSLTQTKRLLRDAALCRIRSRFCLFFPWRGRVWQSTERLLAHLPLGAQFAAFGIKA